MTDPIPAATLVLFRDAMGAPEHLFVERAATMVFAGGALVFPGGRVDPDDRALAARFPQFDPDDAAARIAAIRETIEETGVAVGIDGDVEVARSALLGGATMVTLTDQMGFTLDLDALVPFARWCPNFKETRTFDTRFYIARIDPDHAEARVDATENVHLFWASAADVLAMAEAGNAKIIFPTRRNLERLALLADYTAARTHAALHPIETITPWIDDRDGARRLCIPEGLGYPVTSEVLERAMRG